MKFTVWKWEDKVINEQFIDYVRTMMQTSHLKEAQTGLDAIWKCHIKTSNCHQRFCSAIQILCIKVRWIWTESPCLMISGWTRFMFTKTKWRWEFFFFFFKCAICKKSRLEYHSQLVNNWQDCRTSQAPSKTSLFDEVGVRLNHFY